MSVRYTTRIPEIKRNLQPRAAQAIQTTVHEIVTDAKIAAPVDTGFLRGSIRGEAHGLTGIVEVGAEYGIYVEFGTRYMAAQPFLTPAFESGVKRLEHELRGCFK